MKIITIFILIMIPLTVFAGTDDDMDKRLSSFSDDWESYKEFFFDFRNKLKANDLDALSEMMNFPLSVNDGVSKNKIKTKKEFISKFKDIFTSDVKDVVLNQEYKELFVNWKGLMYGNGTVWVSGICAPDSPLGECKDLKVKVITINK